MSLQTNEIAAKCHLTMISLSQRLGYLPHCGAQWKPLTEPITHWQNLLRLRTSLAEHFFPFFTRCQS